MDNKKEYYDEIMSCQLPLDNAGKQVPALLGVELAFIPEGAKNVDAAKDFLRYLIQPAESRRLPEGSQGAMAAGDAIDRAQRSVLAGSA